MADEFTDEERHYIRHLKTSTNSEELSVAALKLSMSGHVSRVAATLEKRVQELEEQDVDGAIIRRLTNLYQQPIKYEFFLSEDMSMNQRVRDSFEAFYKKRLDSSDVHIAFSAQLGLLLLGGSFDSETLRSVTSGKPEWQTYVQALGNLSSSLDPREIDAAVETLALLPHNRELTAIWVLQRNFTEGSLALRRKLFTNVPMYTFPRIVRDQLGDAVALFVRDSLRAGLNGENIFSEVIALRELTKHIGDCQEKREVEALYKLQLDTKRTTTVLNDVARPLVLGRTAAGQILALRLSRHDSISEEDVIELAKKVWLPTDTQDQLAEGLKTRLADAARTNFEARKHKIIGDLKRVLGTRFERAVKEWAEELERDSILYRWLVEHVRPRGSFEAGTAEQEELALEIVELPSALAPRPERERTDLRTPLARGLAVENQWERETCAMQARNKLGSSTIGDVVAGGLFLLEVEVDHIRAMSLDEVKKVPSDNRFFDERYEEQVFEVFDAWNRIKQPQSNDQIRADINTVRSMITRRHQEFFGVLIEPLLTDLELQIMDLEKVSLNHDILVSHVEFLVALTGPDQTQQRLTALLEQVEHPQSARLTSAIASVLSVDGQMDLEPLSELGSGLRRSY